MANHRHVLLLSAVAAAGCYSGDVAVIAPPSQATIRTTLVITAANHDDSAYTTALGWHGVIRGATVVISPIDTGLPPQVRTVADSLGMVRLDSLIPGTYRIEIQRLLTDRERAQLSSGNDLLGFAIHTTISLSIPDGHIPLPVFAVRQRGLLISEWSFNHGLLPGATDYPFDGFLELYNNGDTTVYLDGIIIAQGSAQSIETQPQSCAQAAALFIDPLGIWARKFDQFPGRGHDYPLAPGVATVVATDAIDHRPIIANGLDLRGANFDFSGPNDIVNPGVPEMIDRGLFADPFGHGTTMRELADVVALVPPLDLDVLPRKLDLTGAEYRRIPRDSLLDVIAFRVFYSAKYPACAELVDPTIVHDQANLDYANDASFGFTHSVNRRVVTERSGRKLLQDTRSGTTDLMVGPRTPGSIP